jgi:hypothetical protein
LKEGARVEPDAPAKVSGLSVFELRVLRLILERELRSVWDVALALVGWAYGSKVGWFTWLVVVLGGDAEVANVG